MPYVSVRDLPPSVAAHLPDHAQEIYRAAFNGAWDNYADRGAMRKRLIVGKTGASGSILALATLGQLVAADVETHLVISDGARVTIAHELSADSIARFMSVAEHVHQRGDLATPIASGSFPTDGMIVAPCSMWSMDAMAYGFGDNLLVRAADVVLKERCRLVIAPRQAPLHEGHLEAMLWFVRMGVVVTPPVPPFYTRPVSMDDIVREIAARLVNWAGVEDPGERMTRWSRDL
jgi:4-hydroxy-3-polyprenylbenzoate decarboxylase